MKILSLSSFITSSSLIFNKKERIKLNERCKTKSKKRKKKKKKKKSSFKIYIRIVSLINFVYFFVSVTILTQNSVISIENLNALIENKNSLILL